MVDKEITIKFRLEKETKHCFRFSEVVKGFEEPIIGTLYIKRSAFASQPTEAEISLRSLSLK